MKKKLLIFLLSFISVHLLINSQELAFSPATLEPLFEVPQNIDQKQKLSGSDIVLLSLRFSLGQADSEKEKSCLEKFHSIENQILNSQFEKMNCQQKACFILQKMHELAFTDYVTEQTRMDVLLEEGLYNCVSSTALYCALAVDGGLEVCCASIPKHLFCRVNVDGRWVNVECTQAHGFDMEDGELVVDSYRYGDCEEESLAGTFYWIASNVLVNQSLNKTRQVEYAATLYSICKNDQLFEAKAAQLLEISVVQYLSFITQNGQWEQGLVWMDGDDWIFKRCQNVRDCYGVILHNNIANFANQGQYDQVRILYDSYSQKLSEEKRRVELENFYAAELFLKLKDMEAEQAIDFMKSVILGELYGLKDVKLVVEDWFVYYTSVLMDRAEIYQAAVIASESRKWLPDNKDLKEFERNAWYDYDVLIHNQFVSLWNEGLFERARMVLEEGIKNHPESKILKKDKAKLGD